MSAEWYYLDSAGQQVGPVRADELRAALRRGAITDANLAWRDGLSSWLPISQLAAELGLQSMPPPLPGSPAPGDANPYRAPDALASSEGYHRGIDDIVYAGFWRRWAALFIDQIILAVPLTILLFVVVAALGVDMNAKEPPPAFFVAYFLFYVVWFFTAACYYAGMESSAGQATLGKRALGIKVTDQDGRRISFKHALGRWFAAALSYMSMYIGFLMAGFTERKRALHDIIAGTLVVDRWAYTQFPERQQRGLSGCLIVFLVVILGGLVMIPILAAISISQYQDYVIRSQVSEGSSLADGVKTAVGEYVNNNGAMPASNSSAGLAEPSEIHGQYVSYVDVGKRPGRIEVGYSSYSPEKANPALEGKHLHFDATINAGSITWSCGSEDLKQKWCPSSCSCHG